MTTRPLRVALIGVGYGAAVHMPVVAACPDAVLVSLADNGSGRAASLAGSGVKAFDDWRQAIDGLDIDAVIVAVPPPAQPSIVAEALRRGIHVLCEKPLGMDHDACCRLRDYARSCGLVLAAGFQFRFEAGILRLREEALSGRLGTLRCVEIQWHTAGRADLTLPMSWQYSRQKGGGILFSHMPHILDLVTWLGGGVPYEVYGDLATRVPTRPDTQGSPVRADAEDFVACRFKTRSGAIGYASISNSQPGGQGLHITLYGSEGTAAFSQPPPFRPADQRVRFRSRSGDVAEWCDHGAEADSRFSAASRLFGRFVDAIRAVEVADLPTATDACAVHAALDQLKQSTDDRICSHARSGHEESGAVN